MKLLHLTDLHLDHVDDDPATAVRALLDDASAGAHLVLTGDISIASRLGEDLDAIWRAARGRPVYFVLGNHDLWRGGVAKTRDLAARVAAKRPGLVYLPAADVVELSPRTALVGSSALYDGRAGKTDSSVRLNDWAMIDELRGLHRDRRAEVLRDLAARDTRRAEDALRRALARYRHVFFATHVPPFHEASVDVAGRPSGPEVLPYYCNFTMGLRLSYVAADFPDRQITVLCGHCHGAADVQVAPNMRCVTGAAVYGHPAIAGELEVP